MKCPSCSHDNPSDAGFCQHCGRPLERSCARCGTANGVEARFCKKCGAALPDTGERRGLPVQFSGGAGVHAVSWYIQPIWQMPEA